MVLFKYLTLPNVVAYKFNKNCISCEYYIQCNGKVQHFIILYNSITIYIYYILYYSL